MQVRADQIETQLQTGLKPVYLITGDEPLQVMEVADTIRVYASQHGFSEREILHVDPQFDWGILLQASEALSLFATRQLLDMRFSSSKIGATGSKALQQYLSHPPQDKLLLIQAPKLDKAVRNAAWVKALDQVGAIVQVWELNASQTQAWVAARMKAAHLKPDDAAVRYLAERVEGNLLAAAQEINKLQLLFAGQSISVEQLAAVTADSARFSVFDLADAILALDVPRLKHILEVLREDDTPLPLVIWALGDVLRQLEEGCTNVRYQRSNQHLIMKTTRDRQALLQHAFKRLANTNFLPLYRRLAILDQHSKGVGEGVSKSETRLWDGVFDLALALMGQRLFA